MKCSAERIHVKVNIDFDATGYMQPKSIIWNDGRIFTIDEVRDYRPAASAEKNACGSCYIILIHGEEKSLFFERSNEMFSARLGRWFVRKKTETDKT